MFILDKLNISNIKSSDPSFSTQQNTYNFCVVACIPDGISSIFKIIAIYCVAGTAASTGTSVRNIDRGNQHDNNTTTHNGFIAYIFFLKWYYSCKLNL